MSEEHEAPINSAKLLLPVAIIGMLILMTIMYKFGGNTGVAEYQQHNTAVTQPAGH